MTVPRDIKLAFVAILLIAGLTTVGYLFDALAVTNQGLAVAANGGDVAPYIIALVMILVAASVPDLLRDL